MGLSRKIAGGVAALSVGALPLLTGVNPAAADETFFSGRSFDHTFLADDEFNTEVTCTFSIQSSLSRPTGRDEFVGNALTSTFTPGGDPRCGDAFVAVDLTYRDGNGVERNPSANAFGEDVSPERGQRREQGLVAHHVAFFLDCVANCEVTGTTSPK